ncbi:hypothetical protein [Cupriavidus sp. YAF13]|uniref:hypothetical protein n=1 Tax=Cupriavidus sp. YAF13 TaxID=3233075 RepID=UPI003F8F40FF
MSETTKPARCRDEDWNLARDCGLQSATPRTNAWDAALGRFADAVHAAPPAPVSRAKEVDGLRRALVYVAHAMHSERQYVCAKGVTLIDNDGVEVRLDDGRKVHVRLSQSASLNEGGSEPVVPIDMVLHCPACGMQHIDAPDHLHYMPGTSKEWDNPPHRSHLCHNCAHIWRPADVPTNGVAAVKTKGSADSPIAQSAPNEGGSESVAWPFRAPGSLCKGSVALGSGCGLCERCKDEKAQLFAGNPKNAAMQPVAPTLFRWKTSWGDWTYRTERPAGWKDLPHFEAYNLSAPEQASAPQPVAINEGGKGEGVAFEASELDALVKLAEKCEAEDDHPVVASTVLRRLVNYARSRCAAPQPSAKALTDAAEAMHAVLIAGGDYGDELADMGLRERLKKSRDAIRALLAAAPASGYCTAGNGCVCGGDTPRVRQGCGNWKAAPASPNQEG